LCANLCGSAKSVPQAYKDCHREPKRTDSGISLADGANRSAITLTKRIRNQLETLAVHGYVLGGGETKVPDPCAGLGCFERIGQYWERGVCRNIKVGEGQDDFLPEEFVSLKMIAQRFNHGWSELLTLEAGEDR
jgi:hypothetical protein